MRPVEKYLRQQYKNGIMTSEILGYHGTSIEGLNTILVSDYLIGSTDKDNEYSDPGDIYYASKIDRGGYWTPFEEAAGYAKDCARRHAFIRMLGAEYRDDILSFHNSFYVGGGGFPEERLVNELASKVGMEPRRVREIYGRVFNYRGIVLGIGENVPSSMITEAQDHGGMRIITNGIGLHYAYVKGLKALGPAEKKYISNLGNRRINILGY